MLTYVFLQWSMRRMDVPLVMRYNANIVHHRLLFVKPCIELLAQLVELSLQKLLYARETRIQQQHLMWAIKTPNSAQVINGLRVSRSRCTRFLAVSTTSSLLLAVDVLPV